MSVNLQDIISNNINKLLEKNPTANANTALQEQALIDKTLIQSGLPENKINSLIAMAKDKLTCDVDCQKERSSTNYKQKWDLAVKQYEQAPEEIKQAEKNYYVFDKGYPAYKDMLYDRYAKSADQFKKTSNEKYKKVNEDIEQLIGTYDTSNTYLKQMNELLRIKMRENKKLKKDIDEYLSATQTSGRKVIYEDRARDWLTTIRYILLFFYFLFLVVFLYSASASASASITSISWKRWLLIILYILFPFYILNKLVRLMFTVLGN
jgi:hypothetical protein